MTPIRLRSAGSLAGPMTKSGAAERVEVRRVVGDVEDVVLEFADQPGRQRQRHLVDGVARLGRRHHVRLGADAADPRRDARHLLDRAALAELLEAAQLGFLN